MWKRVAKGRRGNLHISRAERWRESDQTPIDWLEWKEVAEAAGLGVFDRFSPQAHEDYINSVMWRNDLDRAGAEKWISRRQKEVARSREVLASIPAPVEDSAAGVQKPPANTGAIAFTLTRPDGSRMTFQWFEFQITVINESSDIAGDVVLIAPLAHALNANIYDERGKKLKEI